jgi:hypothetical protein
MSARRPSLGAARPGMDQSGRYCLIGIFPGLRRLPCGPPPETGTRWAVRASFAGQAVLVG